MPVITPVNYGGMNQGLSKLAAAMWGDGNQDVANNAALDYQRGRQVIAEIDKTREDTNKLRIANQREAQFADPAKRNKLAMEFAGGSEADAPALDNFMRTGSVGSGTFQTAPTQSPFDALMAVKKPATPAPVTMASKLAPELSALAATPYQPAGNSVEQYLFGKPSVDAAPAVARSLPYSAETANRVKTASQLAAMMAGAGDKVFTPEVLGRMQALGEARGAAASGNYALMNALTGAGNGQQVNPYDLNNQGLVLNKGTGAVDVGNQPMYESVLGKAMADIAQSKAAATNSYASAGHQNAMAREVANNGGKWQTVDTTNGLVQVNQAGQVRPLGISKAGQGIDKPLTEFQGKAFAFGTRAQDSDKVFREIGSNYDPMFVNGSGIVENIPLLGSAANAMLGANNQQVMQAKRDFINAILRQESGAVIGQSEFNNANKQYFPMPGDSKAVIEQKSANRARVIESFKVQAGPAGEKFNQGSQQNAPSEAIRKPMQGKAPAMPSAAPNNSANGGLSVGAVVDGHTYLGGNPNDPNSWRM